MAGLNELVDAAFQGGKPGPASGTDVDSSSPLSPESIAAPRNGANLIFDALVGTSRRDRAMKRRAKRNGN